MAWFGRNVLQRAFGARSRSAPSTSKKGHGCGLRDASYPIEPELEYISIVLVLQKRRDGKGSLRNRVSFATRVGALPSLRFRRLLTSEPTVRCISEEG